MISNLSRMPIPFKPNFPTCFEKLLHPSWVWNLCGRQIHVSPCQGGVLKCERSLCSNSFTSI